MNPAPTDTAAQLPGAGWLVLVALVVAVGYVIACALWPFAACHGCSGSGKSRSPSGKAWRPCRRCKGTGARVRVGRRLWAAWTGGKDKANGR